MTINNLVRFNLIFIDSTYRQSFNGDKMLELAKQKKRLVRDTWSKLGMFGY